MSKNIAKATFAGGCFWCMVDCFYLLKGVINVVSGYTGGFKENPTYKEVKLQTTGHYEAVQITYDPKLTSYEDVLNVFIKQIDPTDDGGQFQDRGLSYRTAIFYSDEFQKKTAETLLEKLEESKKFDKPIVTKVLPLQKFYNAEEYHQNFSRKNPEEYKEDRKKSGRDKFITKYWK